MAAAVTKQKLSTAKFAVLGGGISGLTAAYRLLNRVKDPSNIIVLESSNRVGGWVQSCVTEHGAVFELGPRSIRPVGKAGMATLKMVCMTQVNERLDRILIKLSFPLLIVVIMGVRQLSSTPPTPLPFTPLFPPYKPS